jgi:hypothetical protein
MKIGRKGFPSHAVDLVEDEGEVLEELLLA